ncbi:MAG: PD-(D/E)XK nuclease family protein [Candidatus Dadabacteria bacterium]|nr:MAG: PD-(D/E)XK nuclease family protein [Candidatus Dadabacteria bacterium]
MHTVASRAPIGGGIKAGEVVMAAMGTTYSFSRISTFEQCPRRFRYRYLDGVREGFEGIEAFMGKQVHAVIEWMFTERRLGRTVSIAQAIERYCDLWDEAMAGGPLEVRVVREDRSLEQYRRLGAQMLARFHRERYLHDPLQTVASEQHFVVPVGGKYRFQGYIDRLARDDDGLLYVIDYKTGARAPRQFAGKEADQLRAYALAVFLQWAEPHVELVLEFLRSDTVVRERLDRSAAASIERALAERIEAVERSTVFPPQPGPLCAWCGYNDICDAASTAQRRPAIV